MSKTSSATPSLSSSILLTGVAATFAQYFVSPESTIPNVGASGAIAGVLGAYILMFPQSRVNVLVGRQIVALPAFIVLGLWIAFQFVPAVGSIAATDQSAGGVGALLADRGYDADWIRAFVTERGWANIPPKRNRKNPICFSPYFYRDRNLVERFFKRSSSAGASRPGTWPNCIAHNSDHCQVLRHFG
jgi:transposase